jgi:thiol-disulfide isomerase/thioredoxin
MTSPLVLAPVLVWLVLALSGALKLREPQASRDAFLSLRMPTRLTASPAPVLLPWGELLLALGLLLLPGWLGVLAAVVTLLLFGVYLLVVGRALRFDEPVRCGCFGKLGLGTISRVTLVRNVLLVLLATVTVSQSWAGESLLIRLGDLSVRDWGWVGGALVAALLAGLVVHGNSAVQEARLPPVDEGGEYLRQPIPFGQMRYSSGDLVPLRVLAEQRPALLVFVNLTCGSCLRVVEALPSFAKENPEVSTLAVFAEGAGVPADDSGFTVPVLVDPERSVSRIFGIFPPAAVLLGGDGLLAGGPVSGEIAVLEFLDDIAAELAEAYDRPPSASPMAQVHAANAATESRESPASHA